MRRVLQIAFLLFIFAGALTIPGAGNVNAQYSCGTISSPAGTCQTGSCALGDTCELAASCASACLSAGAKSCYVCVNQTEVAICRVIGTIELFLGALAVLFFVIGGILYGVAHFLPGAGNQRQNLHSWAVGLMIAAVIMLVLYVFAEPIVVTIASLGNLPISAYPNACGGISF